ncbi:Uncharacterised protein [Urinicoccus massiliensis]|uniref:Uncharacterized protein n=1 Tax=Urinicoccus massiliensis TaxID=1723382 RepID=A0A8H2QRM6_9FIRM|nr:hypothetical protein [Urinicoccus massiliensis]VFB16016.1 Uncharacterised protein [Urinicoccus massiliensis]
MKVRKRIKQVKRGISLAKLVHKGFRLHTAYKGSKILKAGLEDLLKPKYQR